MTDPRNSQVDRTHALLQLLARTDLPTVSTWSIDELSNRLAGLIYADYRDRDSSRQRAKVEAWAVFLGTDLIDTRTRGRVEISVEGVFHEIPVRIWALLRTDIPQEAAA